MEGGKEMAKLMLTQKELRDLIEDGRDHIWQYNTLYQIDHSRNIGNNGGFYLRKVAQKHDNRGGVTRRGRYMPMTAENAAYYL